MSPSTAVRALGVGVPGRRHRGARVALRNARAAQPAAAARPGQLLLRRGRRARLRAGGGASACSSRSRTGRSCACSARARRSTRSPASGPRPRTRCPVTFLVLRNEEYAILKWFGMLENVAGAPGLDLPALDVSAVAAAYGVPSQRVSGREELTEALRAGIAPDGPRLVEVQVAPGMALASRGAGGTNTFMAIAARKCYNPRLPRRSGLLRQRRQRGGTDSTPAIAAAASRPVNTQPPRNVPSSDFLPCTPAAAEAGGLADGVEAVDRRRRPASTRGSRGRSGCRRATCGPSRSSGSRSADRPTGRRRSAGTWRSAAGRRASCGAGRCV